MPEENVAFIYADDDMLVVTNDPDSESRGESTGFWTIDVEYNDDLAVWYCGWKAGSYGYERFRTAKEALDYVFE